MGSAWINKYKIHFVYILYSQNFKRYYIGMSTDVLRRVDSHNFGKVKSTKAFIPWKLIHLKEFKTRIEARTREKYLKSAAGRRWRKNNLGL